jgi:UDP-N-acetylmuramate dehydrogenase
MQIQQNFPLKNLNTFGILAFAQQYLEVTSTQMLIQALSDYKKEPKFILGGGSNMLLTQNIDALVLHINIKGKEVISETETEVIVRCNAGENWHEFVMWCIGQDYGGLENMSLIPGNVGTTPVQNIGAYGAEIKDTMTQCQAIKIDSQEIKIFTNQECEFGYRESIFKNRVKNQYIITAVDFKLTKKDHKINIGYGDIKQQLESKNIENPTIAEVSQAIIDIRQTKLPDPKVLGNSGSFFKNPIISSTSFAKIQQNFPDIKFYQTSPTTVKVPAGWLIEQVGLKGVRFGNCGVHKNQALVLVNYGGASGQEILALSKKVQTDVFEKFGIAIEAEVNVI